MSDRAQQILDTSRALFNDHGIENVAISQISRALAISSGNLTYHFPKKHDIVGRHINELEEATLKTLKEYNSTSDAAQFLDSYVEFMQVTWDYRYLFNGTAYLLENALLSRDQYAQLIDGIHANIVTQIDNMIEFGSMRQISKPFDTRTLVDCIWWQWLGWLDANQLLAKDKNKNQAELLEDGILHQLFLINPYLNEVFGQQLHQEFTRYKAN